MHLYVSPQSSWLVRTAANAVLFSHIGAGIIGLATGTGALLFSKGGRAHRLAGKVFVFSMLTMAAIGACVAPFLPARGSIIGGALTFYLVATAWMTVRRKSGTVGTFEIGAMVFGLAIAAAALSFGIQAAKAPSGILDGTLPGPYFVFASLAALAAALDLRMVVRRGIAGAQRIARHLWRMCLALLIAAVSFFLGQTQLFPSAIQNSSVLYVPEIAVLATLIFWMFRVQLSKRYRGGTPNRPALKTPRPAAD